MAQRVKDLALPLLWLGLLPWYRIEPWLRNFHMPQGWPKEKKKFKHFHGSLKVLWALETMATGPNENVSLCRTYLVTFLGGLGLDWEHYFIAPWRQL